MSDANNRLKSMVNSLVRPIRARTNPVVFLDVHVLPLPLQHQVVRTGRGSLLNDLLLAGTSILEPCIQAEST
jgi:hypothetical protein